MDLSRVKQIFCRQGEVRRILEGDVVLWKKITGILITDFKRYRYAVYTIPVPEPNEQNQETEDVTPVWTVSELPKGLSYKVTEDGLTFQGYAEKTCRKNVTVTVTIGEYSESTLYTFEVTSDGNEIAIASNDLGKWYNGESGVKSGTNILSISGSGASGSAVRYYSSGKPSWMIINSSSGALTGTPNTGYEAQSGLVTVYAIRGGENVEGSYKTPSKTLRWNTTNGIPRFRYTNIRIDCTNYLRTKGNTGGVTFFYLDLSQYYYPIDGGTISITYAIGDVQSGKHVTPSTSGNTLILKKKSNCTTTNGCDTYFTVIASNGKGSSGILNVHCDVHAKNSSYSATTKVESVS